MAADEAASKIEERKIALSSGISGVADSLRQGAVGQAKETIVEGTKQIVRRRIRLRKI